MMSRTHFPFARLFRWVLPSGFSVAPARVGRAAWRDLLPACALLIIGLAGLAIAKLMPTGADGQYAVIAPPWYALPQTISLVQAAHGGIVEVGDNGNVVIASSHEPDFVRALYGAGAWLVIDPVRLRGCLGLKAALREAAQ